MGLIENLGRVASVYMDEKEKLQTVGDKRKRTRMGHGFWPHEVLRDAIIFASMLSVLLFYAWLIPPPLHGAADPYAQAGFVFPDWYVLFSYGYLRWGEYLPQFTVPTGPIGAIVDQPVFAWNAAWWGAALTGIPVGILALPPFLGGREKRPVEDPWYASAGAVYLAHIWFISVFSINIFLELYGKNRTDFCKLDSHGDLLCGTRPAWLAEVFNAIPWLMTGVLLWIVLHFGARMFLVKTIGARLTQANAKRILMGALVLSTAATVATWDTYDKGFWDARGLLTIESYEELEAMRSQPTDVHVHEANEFTDQLGYSETMTVPAVAWLDWQIFQPSREVIYDFTDVNNHQQPDQGINSAAVVGNFSGGEGFLVEGNFSITEDSTAFPDGHHVSVQTIPLDAACSYRAEERKIGEAKTGDMLSSTLTIKDADGSTVRAASFDDCAGAEMVELPVGIYTYTFEVSASGPLATSDLTTEVTMAIAAYQPLLLFDAGLSDAHLAGHAVNLSNPEHMTMAGDYDQVVNPSYHSNPKALDAKLTYAMFIPCLTLGALVFVLLRSMATGYEFEMNKCYGCDLCDDACPVRLFNGGDKLNIIYNTWNNEDDGVPLYSCLTCSACTNACPQLVDYDSYVDIRRSLIVGGPQAEIPHTVLQAVLTAEAEESADSDFIATEDYPITSNVGYYPGCVDYLDQEMVFSHLNEGSMDLGASTTAAFTLFEEMGDDVSYLGRDFLKCCGHDQKWQGMTEVFDKLKAYNQKKIEESGIDTLVSSCAECFRTFARDYELEGVKVMHTTEYLLEQGFDMDLKADEATTVTYHDPCRLGRQMGITEEPRELLGQVENVELVEMEHHGEDAMCCGVSSMMSCNENARALRVNRMEEVRATGANTMLTSCPKCVTHLECLKFEGDERYEGIEILDVVTFLAQQVEAKKAQVEADVRISVEA